MSTAGASSTPRRGRAFDRLGVVLGGAGVLALGALPFVTAKASRIASGHALGLGEALPLPGAVLVAAIALTVSLLVSRATSPRRRLLLALAVVATLLVAIGAAAAGLTPPGNRTVRIAPGTGFWTALLCYALLATDALSRLRPKPLTRVGWLALAGAVFGIALRTGWFDHLSILREYAANDSTFAREARTHALLAFGSVAVALVVGLPLGVVCHRWPVLRAGVLKLLSFVQTVPSIALFGVLMVPLGWLATTYPAVGALGIHGIGPAPAAVALVLYALLPIVANTVTGLGRVSPAAVEAARGMGLTRGQVLTEIEAPLAAPVILTGVRIVVVQNVGLATIAALIGGGGFGTFVFQGVGQTAIDLVLLGAIPTVALAFASAVVLDAVIERIQGGRT